MEIVTKIAPLCLAIIMFSLGLGLTINDFLRVIKYPKNFLVGFICQVILLPIIAFILINLITLTPEIALGVMIIAAAPGGVTSNVLTKLANGDVALSISLTAIVSGCLVGALCLIDSTVCRHLLSSSAPLPSPCRMRVGNPVRLIAEIRILLRRTKRQ